MFTGVGGRERWNAAHPENHATTKDRHGFHAANYMPTKFRLKTFFDLLARFKEITPAQERVYQALVSFSGSDGCYPSHCTLALEAGVCERTVKKALKEAQLRGWIDWTNTRKGRRQSSNHYVFTVTTHFINEIINGISKVKHKTAEISHFFRVHGMHGSPYYYIKRYLKRVWNHIETPPPKLSRWQELFQTNPEAALAYLKS